MTNSALEQLLVSARDSDAAAAAAVDTATIASSVKGLVSVDATRPSFFIPGINGRARCIQKENDLATKTAMTKKKRPPRAKRFPSDPPATTLKKTTTLSDSPAHKLDDPVSLEWITVPSPDSAAKEVDLLLGDTADLDGSSTHSETIHLAQELCDVVMRKARATRSIDDQEEEDGRHSITSDTDEIDERLLASEYAAQDRVFSELRATLLPPKTNTSPCPADENEVDKVSASPKSSKKTKKHAKHSRSNRGESGSEKSKRKHKKSSKKTSKSATVPPTTTVDLEESRKSVEEQSPPSELTPRTSPRSTVDADQFVLRRTPSTDCSLSSSSIDVSRASFELSDVAEQEQHIMSVLAPAVMHKDDSFLPNRFFEPSPATPFCPFDVDEGPAPMHASIASLSAHPMPPPPPLLKGDKSERSKKHVNLAVSNRLRRSGSLVENEFALSKLKGPNVTSDVAACTIREAYGHSARRRLEQADSVRLRASTVKLSAASPSLAKRRQSSQVAKALLDQSSLASF